MIQAARHLAAFWPIQGADVIPTDKKQRPQRGLAGALYARLTAQALGGRGAWKRPAFVDFEPDRFRNLYQIAHSERRWKSGITPHVAATQQLETEGAPHARPKSGHILPA